MKIEKKRRVVITGLGTVNPTGNTVAESWAAVKAGRCAVGPITAFDTTDFKVKLAAEVKDFDPAERIDRREARKMARFTQFAVAAADEAIHDSGIALENIDHTRFGVILSSGIGGLPTIEEEHTRGQQRGFEKVSPYFVPMSIGNMAAGQVAIRFGLQGMCSCPTTACAGGTNAIGDAFHRIRDGYEDRMLCGGSESCISPLGVGGFASMKALCTADDPARASIPFDARRSGFVMGEGTMLLYPLSTMGAHVSDCPNHTVGRVTPFETRGHVALAGTFGYELDITKIPEKDRQQIPAQTAMYHKYNDLIRRGDYSRIASFLENGNYDCYQVTSKDQKEALVTYVQVLSRPNFHSRRVRLKGLAPEKQYRIEETGEIFGGDVLMQAGLLVTPLWGDYRSKLIHLTEV